MSEKYSFLTDPVEILAADKFPIYEALRLWAVLRQPYSRNTTPYITARDQQVLTEAESYKKEIRARYTPEELVAMAKKLEAEKAQAKQLQAMNKEQSFFFHQPDAQADFEHWSKAAYWSIDEAVALLLGKDPEIVTWAKIEPLKDESTFARDFARVRDLAMRSKEVNELTERNHPGRFLEWARQRNLKISGELIAAVEAAGVQIIDWQERYLRLKVEHDEQSKLTRELAKDLDDVVTRNTELQDRIAQLDSARSSWEFDEDDPKYPEELDIAMQVWRAATNQKDFDSSTKQWVVKWLNENYSHLSGDAKKRISIVANWDRRGGRRAKRPNPSRD